MTFESHSGNKVKTIETQHMLTSLRSTSTGYTFSITAFRNKSLMMIVSFSLQTAIATNIQPD